MYQIWTVNQGNQNDLPREIWTKCPIKVIQTIMRLQLSGFLWVCPCLYLHVLYYFSSSVQFSRSVVSDSLRPHELHHARPPCPSPTPRVHQNSCPSSQWCHPAISSSVVPFSSCRQSLPASVFYNESTLCMRWPKYWSFSFSISHFLL